jgi:hypothetical protein
VAEKRIGDDLQEQVELLIKGHTAREQVNALASALARVIAADYRAAGKRWEHAVAAAVNVGHTMATEITNNWDAPIDPLAARAEARQ